MLERIRSAVSLRRREAGSRSPSSASTRRAPTSTSTARPTRPRSRPARRRSSSSTRSGSRRRRRPRTSSAGRSSGSGRRSRSTGTATTTSASPRRPRWRPSRPARPGCRARSTAWASGPATPTSARSRSRCEALYGIHDGPPPRPHSRSLDARPGALRLRARAVEAAHRREPVHARERRRRGAVPRPAGDRAVLLRARRGRARGSCSGRRAASTRSGSRSAELGLDVPEERFPELLAAVKRARHREARPRQRRGAPLPD